MSAEMFEVREVRLACERIGRLLEDVRAELLKDSSDPDAADWCSTALDLESVAEVAQSAARNAWIVDNEMSGAQS